MTDTLRGTIVEVVSYQQHVRTDDGQDIWLGGVQREPYSGVGDRVILTWMSGSAYGFWVARKEASAPGRAVRLPETEKCGRCGFTAVRDGECRECGARAVADLPEWDNTKGDA